MTTDLEPEVTAAEIEPIKTLSKIWLVPIIAALIGGWMLYFHISNQGPQIQISFETGDGIEAGKTKIKIKNVEVGTVESLALSASDDGVIVTARIQNNSVHLLNSDTQFWVVRPKIGKGGVSGLSTLLSGAYIELAPGSSDQEKDEFVGLENEPVTPAGTPGLHITLIGGSYKALDVGDSILFHGIEVGRIEYVHFNTQERVVYYNAFIDSPYDSLITTNTKFWEVSGVEVELSADGIRVQSGTLETMIAGGVTFDVPKDMVRGERVTEREFFNVFPNRDAIYENRFTHSMQLILLFKNSIRGLTPGAPVEYKGIRVGTVTRTDAEYDEITRILNQDSLIPVMISIEPARIGFGDDADALPVAREELKKLLLKGLQGGLANGNLLTGSKYIELEYAETPVAELQTFSEYMVIPTFDSQFAQIVTQVSKLLDKVNKMPVENVVTSADESLKQMTKTLKDFEESSEALTNLLQQAEQNKLIETVNSSLASIQQLTNDFSSGSTTHRELEATLNTMKKALAELEPLLTQLNQKPNSLIFNSGKKKDIEPKGSKP
jgi:paraquat-inducible protein B